MKINRKFRLQVLIQNWFFVILFLSLMIILGYLANEYRYAKDITHAGRNTLSQGSIDVLKQMKGAVNMTVYATKDDASGSDTFRKTMRDFVSRFQRTKKDINLTFINPTDEPKLAQEAGVKVDGEVVVEYNKRTEHITPPFAEQELTNLLVRLSRTNTRPIMFLDGHGERHLQGIKNHDIGEFGKQLENKGFKLANPNLVVAQEVPSNGAMLVIASPQVDVSEIEAKKIVKYLDTGGNLLWLLDSDNLHGLQAVADHIGLKVSPGIVIDPNSAQYGTDEKVAFANRYGDHPITKSFMLQTLFPETHEVSAQGTYENGWKVSQLVEVAPNGWLESDKLDGKKKITFDAKADKVGPINIGVAIERAYGKKGQRVVVMANANFLANTFITNGGNLDLGVNIVNWLAGDDTLITVQPMPLKDVNMSIPAGSIMPKVVGYGTQMVIPACLLLFGIFLWWKRRKA